MWDEVCSPKMQWWSLLALADLYVINSLYTDPQQRGTIKTRAAGRAGHFKLLLHTRARLPTLDC